jgi:alpha-amylase/alpha-mannosidase (GH57 family)
MGKVYFLFCVHNHQPVGNFEHVIEEAYQKSYKPFIELMYKYPKFKFALHCSGILWDYFLEKHKEYIDIVKEMVKREQVELISGGYYEPILSSIPQNDRLGQIKMMNKFLYSTFGVQPQGLWLTERVWEQSVVKDIVDAQIKYTLVDDYVFYSAGINRTEEQELTDYYITEEEGKILYVFPISQTLRYYIPFKPVKDLIELFSKFANQNQIVSLTIGDDGEKFGVWPQTYEHVYKNGWLKDFVEHVLQNEQWLETISFTEYVKLKPPKGRIYLPTASYFEMGEWCLPISTQMLFEQLIKNMDSSQDSNLLRQFVHGGYWKNFLSKYPESNNMHKKMLFVSELVKKSKNDEIKKMFYKSQCNCAYWHGVFGGLYLPHLREAIYSSLINVEKQIIKKSVYVEDIDKDTKDEVLISSEKYSLYLKPSYGGCVYELDLKQYDKNLLNVLSRKKEAYHKRLIEFEENNNTKLNPQQVKTIHDLVMAKEQGLSKKLYYDWHQRYSFLDHFLHPNTTFENFYKSQYGEQGNFTIEEYQVDKIDKKNFVVSLSRIGNVWVGSDNCRLKITKKYSIEDNKNSINCEYYIENLSEKEISLWFLTELNMLVFGKQQNTLLEFETESYKIIDEDKKFTIEINSEQKKLFWVFPIETISMSEAGFERTYQGLCIAISSKFVLQKEQMYTTKIVLEIK